MDFTKWAYHPDTLPKDLSAKDKHLMELEDRFFEELKANPDVQAWLQQHRVLSGNYDDIIRSHARHKRNLVSHGWYYLRQMDNLPELRYRDECAACIEAIQQKKLFELQLQWRAGTAEVPGVRIAIDFSKLDDDVLACDFLDPVTPDDIALMKDFLATDAGAEWIAHGGRDEWQRYEYFFEEGELTEEYPEWYRFWDEHHGTGYLLQLPNHRGKKEEYYEELGRAVLRQREGEKEQESPGPAAPADSRPYLNYWDEYQRAFYEKFEDPYFRALFQHERQSREKENERNGNYEPHDDLHYLEDFSDPAPMPACANWREALYLCRIRSHARAVTSDLDAAYAEYAFYRETGMRPKKENKFDVSEAWSWLYDMILEGRAAAGEPRDFNF